MTENPISEIEVRDAELIDLGDVLGQIRAFGLIAGRCSAAQAEGLRRLREQKLYKRCAETWGSFCTEFLKISRTEADRTIRELEEFGPVFFELSQLTRISPGTYRAIAPAIQNGALHFNGESIALRPENSHKVSAAVAELRRAIPKKEPWPELELIVRELKEGIRDGTLSERITELDKCCTAVIEEFDRLARAGLGMSQLLFKSSLTRVRQELDRIALECGIS